MMTLIWKEVRENIKWALLLMLVLTGGELYALYPPDGAQEYQSNFIDGLTLCKTPFLDVTTFGCAAAGFLLGLIQILPELKRDRWAALLHRPVSRGVIFRGKAVAGLVLYGVATVPPFLVSVWLVATPGHVASPFVPEMVFPGSADICMGGAYYFAALALALQRGGWIGLRAFPLLAAIHATFFVLGTALFPVAVEAAVLLALALCTAAWGQMYNQDALQGRPWLGRCAFLAVVFYGACGLGDLARAFFTTLAPSSGADFSRYELTDEGIPLRVTYSSGGVVLSVRHLDGSRPVNPDYQPDRLRNHMKYLNEFSKYIGQAHGFHPARYRLGYRETQSYLWTNSSYSNPRPEQWFTFVHGNYLIGYLPEEKLPFALLDQHGFEPWNVVPAGFSRQTHIDYTAQDAYCIWEAARARYAFLAKRRMVDLTLPAPAPIYGMGTAWARTDRASVGVIGLSLGRGIAVYDNKAALLTLLPYHQEMDRWGDLSLGINGTLDRFYLEYQPSEWIDPEIRGKMPSFVEEMNLQGQVLRTYTLPPLPRLPPWTSWDNFLARRLQSPAFFFGTMLYKEAGAKFGSKRLQRDWARQFGQDRALTKEVTWDVVVLSCLLAGATLFWARSVYFPSGRAWAWTCFVLAFGLPGFLAFRLAADWPRSVPCPRCQRRRPIDAGSCPHCGAEWPAPPSSGFEIFDQPPAHSLATPI